MPRKSTKPAVREQLQMTIEDIARKHARSAPPPAPPIVHKQPNPLADRVSYAPAPEPERPASMEPFGRWLLAQRDRGDWIDELCNAARRDPRFPKNGSPDDAREHLGKLGVEGDVFEQIDDAERHWLSQ